MLTTAMSVLEEYISVVNLGILSSYSSKLLYTLFRQLIIAKQHTPIIYYF